MRADYCVWVFISDLRALPEVERWVPGHANLRAVLARGGVVADGVGVRELEARDRAFADERVNDCNDKVLKAIGHKAEPAVQNIVVDLGEDVFKVFDETCAKNRADQRARTTKYSHQNDLT